MKPRRVFLGWDSPVLPKVADYLADRYRAPASPLNPAIPTVDLSDVVVVVPARRAGRRLLELLADKLQSSCPGFLPPRIMTFRQFPERLYPQQKQLADDLTQLLVWKRALDGIPSSELTAAFPHLPDDGALSARLAVCESLRRRHEELAAEGMEFDDVAAALSQTGNHEEAARWQAMRRIQAEYLMQMDAAQLWDRQAARLIAVQEKECSVREDVILVGTVDMNGIVRRMLEQIAESVSILVPAPEAEAGLFDEWGCLIPSAWEDRVIGLTDENLEIVDTPEEQALAVARRMAAQNPAVRPDELAIGFADESLLPLVRQTLEEAGAAVNLPVGDPLTSTAPAVLLEHVARHLATAAPGELPDFISLERLLRHPDLEACVASRLPARADMPAPTELLHSIDLFRQRHLPPHPVAFPGRRSEDVQVRECLKIMDVLLALLVRPEQSVTDQSSPADGDPSETTGRKRQLTFEDQAARDESHPARLLQKPRPLKEWLPGIIRFLKAVYSTTVVERGSDERRQVAEFGRSLEQTARRVYQIGDSLQPRCTIAQAIPLILGQLDSGTLKPTENPDAYDCLGWLELPLDDSPVLHVVGLNEGSVPQSVSSDVFLPNTLRKDLGLTDNTRRYARDAYALTVLLNSGRDVHFTCARENQDGDPLLPSRFWLAVPPQELPARIRRFYEGPKDAVEPLSAEEAKTRDSDSRRETAPSQFRIPALRLPDEPLTEIPVTHFGDYLRCPYRYAVQRRLKLQSVNHRVREMDALAFGNLMHDVLDQFSQSAYNRSRQVREVSEFLCGQLHQAAGSLFGRKRTAGVNVQLEMMRNRLEAFAHWQVESVREGWQLLAAEKQLRREGFRIAGDHTITLVGRVDRIDYHEEQKIYRVLDYKTSEKAVPPEKAHRNSSGEWTNLQLPLYRVLLESQELDGTIQLGYVNLGRDPQQIRCLRADWSEEDLDDAEARAREVAAEIIAISQPVPAKSQRSGDPQLARLCQESVQQPLTAEHS